MERKDDEEDDDQENLVAQSEPMRAAFQMEDVNDERVNTRGFNFSFNKWCILAIVVPVVIITFYLTTDVDSLFRIEVMKGNYDVSVNSMRESEFQALYLLRQQELGLSKLWSSTLLDNSSDSTPAFSSVLFEELKLDLLSQISLNKQIQQALLSSHQLGNLLNASDNATDTSVDGYGGLRRCRKVEYRLSGRRTIEWKPKSDKYLFAICASGQMSNHLICLEKHMFFAALLNRILIIPSSKVDYEFRRVLDIGHINKCLERTVVVTFEEFAKSRKGHMHIDKFICYFSKPQPCFLDDEHVKKLKSLGVSMNKLEAAWDEDVKNPKPRTVQDIMTKFSLDDDVIAIGDVFFANVEKKWVMQPGGPISHKCKTLVEPSRLILLTAQRFIQTFSGGNFIALHFRRHGFLKFCNAKNSSCFYPVPQAADCINRAVERSTAPVVYLSTDAAESETGLLQLLLVVNGKKVPLVRRPTRNSNEKWDALLYRRGLEGDRQEVAGSSLGNSLWHKCKVEAMLDKTICAMSDVFIGSMGSTFTEDILRLRKDWGSASNCDEYLCQDSRPSFSLVLSQLDSQKQDIPVGFVPNTFDCEEFNFAKNRPKHRNEPTTMQKLKEAVSSRSKKSGSKAARVYYAVAKDTETNRTIADVRLGLRLLSRVKPSEIFLKSIPKEVTRVDITYPSSLNGRLVRRRLRHIAMRGSIIHKKYFYGSVTLLPLTSFFMVLPLPNIPFFWVLFRTYSHWRALQGSENLLQLVTNNSDQQKSEKGTTDKTNIKDDPQRTKGCSSPPWVLKPSEDLQKLIRSGEANDGLSEPTISDICKRFNLITMDVVKYKHTL
ncbi:putative protein STRUBBELIG-RECEPTOR FAMILY 7-like [Capsicum annuum]|nr:putative protein STRUBBELIG-RECEPTOR FAMILY 7-like [Capsicum annuum]